MSKQQYCPNCGVTCGYDMVSPVDEELSRTWELTPTLWDLFNIREGSLCQNCGVNIRGQGLARAILASRYGLGAASLVEWVKQANKQKLSVCELNGCHKLHDTLAKLKQLAYSEFGSDNEQDIENLTYASGSFDLVLHSETLEHVPNPRLAMDECRRVIKQDGLVLFTTPVIWNRTTRRRADIVDGAIDKLLEPSYHGYRTDDYLVYFEYGSDCDKLLGSTLAYKDWRHQNYVFQSGKVPTSISLPERVRLKVLQQRAIRARKAK